MDGFGLEDVRMILSSSDRFENGEYLIDYVDTRTGDRILVGNRSCLRITEEKHSIYFKDDLDDLVSEYFEPDELPQNYLLKKAEENNGIRFDHELGGDYDEEKSG